jgi:hypothetical protein
MIIVKFLENLCIAMMIAPFIFLAILMSVKFRPAPSTKEIRAAELHNLKVQAELRKQIEHLENMQIKQLQQQLLEQRIAKESNNVVLGDIKIEAQREDKNPPFIAQNYPEPNLPSDTLRQS